MRNVFRVIAPAKDPVCVEQRDGHRWACQTTTLIRGGKYGKQYD
jgi:hypothetical protein